jgi:hypothetical protein
VRELDSTEIKKIAYNCRKATYLIEKKQLVKITLRERLELQIHLAGCSVCKTFEQQSMVINHMVKELLDKTYFGFSLEEGYKIFLHEKIEKKINLKL